MTTTTTAPPATVTAPPPAPKGFEPVRVAFLRFLHPGGGGGGVELGPPFRSGTAVMIKAGKQHTDEDIQIQHEPWHRMYRVRMTVNGKLAGERLIPESWALYEPETIATIAT